MRRVSQSPTRCGKVWLPHMRWAVNEGLEPGSDQEGWVLARRATLDWTGSGG